MFSASTMRVITLLLAAAFIASAVAQPTCTTPYQALVNEPTLSIAKQAVDAAGLKDFLDDPTLDATIFIPSNDGFATFLQTANASAEDLLGFKGLENILKYHVHLVAHNVSDLYEGEVVDMANGDTISINFVKEADPKYAGCGGYHLHIGSHSVTDADPLTCDIQACKSIIHIIDHPFLPEDESITEAFPDVEIRADTGNEEAHDHDHDEDEDHDHGDEVLGEGSAASMPSFGHMIAAIAASVLMLAMH
eukprot:jgi/Picsp_1/3057/NSC_01279-R1_beta-ig-h3 fasciclin